MWRRKRAQPVLGRVVGKHVADALGLQSARRITITYDVADAVIVNAEFYMDRAAADQVLVAVRDTLPFATIHLHPVRVIRPAEDAA